MPVGATINRLQEGIFIGDEEEKAQLPPKKIVEEDFEEERNVFGINRGMAKPKLTTNVDVREKPDNTTLKKLVVGPSCGVSVVDEILGSCTISEPELHLPTVL